MHRSYEWGLLQQKTGLTAAEVAAQVEALIVTQGAEGSVIYTAGRTLRISSVKPQAIDVHVRFLEGGEV